MDREPLINRKTAISYKTEEKTVMRGYDLSELAEEGYSFCDALFVMYQNRIPTEEEEKMLKYEMGVFMEHSMSPSAVGAIGVSAGRPNLPCAIAAAVTTFAVVLKRNKSVRGSRMLRWQLNGSTSLSNVSWVLFGSGGSLVTSGCFRNRYPSHSLSASRTRKLLCRNS